MDAIGGVFVGGVAASGGYGSVVGTLVGIFRNHAVKDRSSIYRTSGKLAADHYRCSSYHCSTDRYHERKKKCTLITETYRLAYRQSASKKSKILFISRTAGKQQQFHNGCEASESVATYHHKKLYNFLLKRRK